MLIMTGIFENERFIPDNPISIPQNKKVVVTINEEMQKTENPDITWRELCETILNCNEELPGDPIPVAFRKIEEMIQ